MAYDFNGTTQYLTLGSAALTDEPMTLACWFNPDTTTASMTMVGFGANTASGFYRLALDGATVNDPIYANKQDAASGSGVATKDTNIPPGTWHHGAAIFAGNNSRVVYYDGIAGAVNVLNFTDPVAAFTSIGALRRSTAASFFDGKIAEVAIWNVVLTADEVAQLARGYSPLWVRPQNLVHYVPLVRDLVDRIAGVTWTNIAAAAVSPHPRVILPHQRYVPGAPVAAAGSVIDVSIIESLSESLVSGINGDSFNEHSVNGPGPAEEAVTESSSAQVALGAAIAEVVTAVDAPTATLVTSAAVVEPLTAVDSTSAIAGGAAQFAVEAVNALDAQAAVVSFVASVAEPLAAADTASARSVVQANVNEVLNASDTASVRWTLNANVNEVLNAQDTQIAFRDGEVVQPPSGGATRAQHLRFRGLRQAEVRVELMSQAAEAHAGELCGAGDAVAYIQGQCARVAGTPECRLPYTNLTAPVLEGQAAYASAGTLAPYVFHPAQHAVVQLMRVPPATAYSAEPLPIAVRNPSDADMMALVTSLARRRRRRVIERLASRIG